MIKTLRYGYLVLGILWKANGIYAGISIFSKLYSNIFFPLLQVYLLSKVLDLIAANQNLHISDFTTIIIIYVLGAAINTLTINLLNTRDMVFDYRLQDYIAGTMLKKLAALDPATFENPKFQDLLAQVELSRYHITEFVQRFVAMLSGFVMFVTALLVVGVIFPLFVPIILVSALPFFFALQNYRKQIYPYLLEQRPKMARIGGYLVDLLSKDSTSKEVAIFKNGDLLVSKGLALQSDYMKSFTKTIDNAIRYVFLADLLQLVTFIATQFYNLSAVLAGRLTIGQFSLIFQQTSNLTQGIDQTLDHYSAVNNRLKYLDQYFDFINYPRFIQNPTHPKEIPDSTIPPTIEFKNVSFKYPDTDRFILKDFNLTINSGDKVALVGENGAGKTTIIKLLLRFYDPIDGEILLNGINIKEVDIEKWHELTGALFQDFIKYQFTFRENVYYGDSSKKNNEEAVKEAIKKSGANAFLDDLPDGLDQMLGKTFNKGIDLSGGQWQKLALARAFFRNAPVLILDEPTSSIDAKAEYEIFENVQKLQKDKTVIIISHRFSTVRNADKIFVLEEGKIIEEGNHTKLIKEKGLYAELFEIQAQGYK